MTVSNMLNTTDISGPLDFGSMGNRSSLFQSATSSPRTFFDGTLMSPANISLGGMTTPGTSTGSEAHESGAYARLWRQFQQREQEMVKTKEELECLKITYRKLVESHCLFVSAYMGSMKRPRAEDYTRLPNPSNTIAMYAPSTDGEEPPSDTLRPSDYPRIHYWYKTDWFDFKNKEKESSAPGSKAGPRGRTRCAQGKNVSMQYIENTDGEPIDGWMAASIREFARTIWADFYDRGMAPTKWSEATRDVKDKYAREMEKEWPVLRYCNNHWKAHAIATNNYPQWYKSYSTKKLEKSNEPARKRRKTVLEDDENSQSESESETNAGDGPMPEGVDEEEYEDINHITSSSGATPYRVLDVGPGAGLALPVTPHPHPATRIVSGLAPLATRLPTQMQGPVAAPPVTPLPPPPTQLPGPGVAPPVSPLPPPLAKMHGPVVVLPVTPSVPDTNVLPDVDLNAPTSSTGGPQKGSNKTKYSYTMPLKPGIGVSAGNLCAVDWLEENPGDKTGEFNRYWGHQIDPKENAAYEETEVAERAKTQAEKKKRGIPPRRLAALK